MSLSGLRKSPKSSEILNEKLLSCESILQKSDLIKIFKQLNDSKKKLIKLKELNYLDDLDELEQIKRLEYLENSKKSFISSQLTELKELDEKIKEKTLSLNKIHDDKLTKDTTNEKKQIVSENINSEIKTLNTQKNILKKLISTYNDVLIEFDLKNIKNLIELIKELKEFKEELKDFIRKKCDHTTISSDEVDTLISNLYKE
jgi:hypothetical protein